ncbi:hypothetical protein M145_3605, partial [Bacteroides fragilis str. 34-F-2 
MKGGKMAGGTLPSENGRISPLNVSLSLFTQKD